MSRAQEAPRHLHLIEYMLATTTIMAITVIAYGRTTGFDPTVWIVGSRQILASVLFAMVIAISAVSAALLLSGVPKPVIRAVAICTILLATGSVVLIGADANPAEWLRFFAVPVAAAALPVLCSLNFCAFVAALKRGNRTSTTVRDSLVAAPVSFALGVVLYVVTNLFGLKGFFTQTMLILFVAVAPLLSLLIALAIMADSRRLTSPAGALLTLIAIGCLIALTTL